MSAIRRLIGIPAAGLIAGLSGAALAQQPGPGWPAGGDRVAAVAPAADPDRILGIDPTPDDCAETRVANQALGGLIGGVVGGLIGSGIGKGSGNTVATIGGAVAGALGGAALGDRVAGTGEACLPEPDAAAWRNPDAPAAGDPIRLTER